MRYANRANLSAGMLEGNGLVWTAVGSKFILKICQNWNNKQEEAKKQLKQKTLTKVSELGRQLAPFPAEFWWFTLTYKRGIK